MKFETAKTVVKLILIFALVLCIVAVILSSTLESEALSNVLVGAALCSIAAAVFFAAVGLKCPYCGRHIFKNVLRTTVCPHCRRNLVSGLKSKGRK